MLNGWEDNGRSRRAEFMRALFWAIFAAFGLGALALRAEVPQLLAGVAIRDGVADLTVNMGDAAPEAVDWDNDGRKDLLVGQYGGGLVRLYLNQGSSNNPIFNGFAYVQCAGVNLATSFG